MTQLHDRIATVTERIRSRSHDRRQTYLEDIAARIHSDLGDVAQMKRADEAAKNIKLMNDRMIVMESKMDAIMAHLKIPQPAVMVR